MMKSKFGYALLALAISFGLWLYVITTVSPESVETYFVPVVLDGEAALNERGLMITEKDDVTVELHVSGNRSDLIKANKDNITIKADLSAIEEPGENINLPLSSVRFPGDIPANALKVESKHPRSITVTVEERRNKEVPVVVKWIGSSPEGFLSDRENSVLDYPTITVVGPASVADQITKAVIEVDLGGKKESISQSYRYTLCNEAGEPVDARLITTNVQEVHLDVKITKFKDLQLSYNVVEGGGAHVLNTTIELGVKSIRVSGSEAVLESLGDELVIGTFNLKDLPKATTLIFPINLPEGVTNLSGVTEVEAAIQFTGLSVREFTVDNIQSLNVPEGMEAEIITEKVAVGVRGPLATMQDLRQEDVYLTVDFTGAEAGTTTFKASVVFPEGFEKVGALGTVSVSATVRKK